NPLCPVDLVIDHSVMVDEFGHGQAFKMNVRKEFARNAERYKFLRWGQTAFDNFRVVPPGTGICHQVNLEYLAQVVWIDTDQRGKKVAYPDTLVGTDSHTTMINGLGVLGWGVGGIEAEAAMLGQPTSMLIPEVVGVKLTGKLREWVSATDLVLTITQMLRKHGVVGKFVEFYGPGLDDLPLADRATIANMAPEYGATCGIFPIDGETIKYLKLSGREAHRVALVEAYAKTQGLWRDKSQPEPIFTDKLALDLSTVEACMAGPRLPQDRVDLTQIPKNFELELPRYGVKQEKRGTRVSVNDGEYFLRHGDVVIAAITSCTNTSNPGVMIAAGLLARKARQKGLTVKPWVKTSLAPGSQVVTDYLEKAGLNEDLDALGFNLVGYGCTTCIGNSGNIPDHIAEAIEKGDLTTAAVLSGNRNFEGRVNPLTKANYLASPPLVVAYALAGNMTVDVTREPLGKDPSGTPVFLKDIWPTRTEIDAAVGKNVTPEMFTSRYADVFKGPAEWSDLLPPAGYAYQWEEASTYVRQPPVFDPVYVESKLTDFSGARLLAMFGDNITTDHISPAGDIKKSAPAGTYLQEKGVQPLDFNSYGARRGNHEVMMRGTFANIRIKNELMDGAEGGNTKHQPSGETLPIYEAAMRYAAGQVPLIIIAGKEYGTGSSRDWAAKGTRFLGVRAVIAESFERIHRSNLVGMGVLPLVFTGGKKRGDLMLNGTETFALRGLAEGLKPRQDITLIITRADGRTEDVALMSRIDTLDEVDYMNAGGILPYVLGNLLSAA
ncbi:MAG: aconitate hydratase AcnA, partial [Alphaproteobacteria bacterium]|nr:aconitate hydratase AcnA [Alphaproteobacteria bacterium]